MTQKLILSIVLQDIIRNREGMPAAGYWMYFYDKKSPTTLRNAYYKKLQIIVEGLFCLHWQGKVKRYFGGALKMRCFGSARKEIVKERIKKMLNVSRLCDHTADSVAGLFAAERPYITPTNVAAEKEE